MTRNVDWQIACWTVMAVALSIPTGGVLAQCADARLEPPDAVVHGKTIGEWSAAWWQWLAGIPEDGSHPFIDLSGAYCARDQDEAVFFLPGSLIVFVINGNPVPQTQCVVPCGKPILLAISWALMWAPGDCEPERMEDCVALARSTVDQVTSVEATVDGVPIPCPENHRVASPVFDFTLPPPPNLFSLDEPLTRKGVSDGHWLLLKPLPPGRHTILLTLFVGGEELPLLHELTVAPCDGEYFRRGDADGNQVMNLTDAVYTLSHLFQGGAAPRCQDAGDADDSGVLDLTDPIYMLNHLFRGGSTPPAPGPDLCGADPTQGDDLGCEQGC